MTEDQIAALAAEALAEIKLKIRAVGISRALGGTPTPQAVGQWSRVPAEYCLRLEAASGVSRYRQRPDVYGPEPEAPNA